MLATARPVNVGRGTLRQNDLPAPESRATALSVIADNIPLELRDVPQWVGWQLVPQPGRPKPSKVPINPRTGRSAKPNDPRTWGAFADALAIYQEKQLAGVGFMFSADDPFTGVDLDGCRDPATGRLDPWAEEILAAIDSYTEVSPSRTGVKQIIRGAMPADVRHRRGAVEVYNQGRYFALTGQRLAGFPADVQPRQDALDRLCEHLGRRPGLAGTPITAPAPVLLDGDELIRRACAARNGAKFKRLWEGDWHGYPSQSEAELALCRLIAFWVGSDPGRIDALFRHSRLLRPNKWDQRHSGDGQSYGELTIAKAVTGLVRVYTPRGPKAPSKRRPRSAAPAGVRPADREVSRSQSASALR
jgi:primase-polymerase (primpol)-like protein